MPRGKSELQVIISVLVFYLLLILSYGSPVRHKRSTGDLPWASPCEPTTTTTSTDTVMVGFFTPVEPTLSELTEELHLRSLEAHSLSMALKDLFFVHRLSSSNSLAQVLETYHLQNYPLPDDVLFWTHQNFTGDVAKKDYINLSTSLVYLEAIKFDDIEHHNSSLVPNINSLEQKLLSILCTLNNIISNLELSVDSHVSREVMPDALREITDHAERHKRDYIMAKDCVHMMTKTKDSHLAMKLGLQ